MEPICFREKAARIVVEGHRGGKFDFENTLSAFKKAIGKSLYGIEFDVWLTKDKIPIVIHGEGENDAYIGYESESFGVRKDSLITELNLQQIKSIVLPNGELIPTLEELLDVCGNRIKLNIEIKDANPEVCQIVLNMLTDKGISNKMAWFTSFKHEILRELSRLDNSFEIGYLYEPDDLMDPEYYPFHGNACNIAYTHLTSELVERCHKNGMKTCLYFSSSNPEDSSFYQNIVECGVDCVISDKPMELLSYLESVLAQE